VTKEQLKVLLDHFCPLLPPLESGVPKPERGYTFSEIYKTITSWWWRGQATNKAVVNEANAWESDVAFMRMSESTEAIDITAKKGEEKGARSWRYLLVDGKIRGEDFECRTYPDFFRIWTKTHFGTDDPFAPRRKLAQEEQAKMTRQRWFSVFNRALWIYAGNKAAEFNRDTVMPLKLLLLPEHLLKKKHISPKDEKICPDNVRRLLEQFYPLIPENTVIYADTVGTKISEISMLLQWLRLNVTPKAFEAELTDSSNGRLLIRPSTSEPGDWVFGLRYNGENRMMRVRRVGDMFEVTKDDGVQRLRTVNELLLHVIEHTPGATDLKANKDAVAILKGVEKAVIVPKPSSIQEFEDVRSWLDYIGFGVYADAFIDAGWDDLKVVLKMTADDLKHFGLSDIEVKVFLTLAKNWTLVGE
jgi:hypothetical protein